MLKRLKIQNFVIVEDVEILFDQGLCVLTGETGAGKSLLLDALMGVLGQRTPTDVIRQGKSYAYLEASFAWTPDVQTFLKGQNFDELLNEEHLVLSRTIQKNGSKSRLNGQWVNQRFVKQLGALLVDSVGQHDNQSLFQDEAHLGLLDKMGSPQHQRLLVSVEQAYQHYAQLKTQLNKAQQDAQNRLREKDFVLFQLQEIADAELAPDEDHTLQEEVQILRHAESLKQDLTSIYFELYGNQDLNIYERLESVQNRLTKACEIDPGLNTLAQTLEEALIHVQEVSRELSDYESNLDSDPKRLEWTEERLDVIRQLKNKYGNSVADILRYQESLLAKKQHLDHDAEHLETLETQLKSAKDTFVEQAQKLSDSREKLGKKLTPQIIKELKALGMPKVSFEIHLTPIDTWNETGLDKAAFYFGPNPGEPPKPLSKTASGGEASRLLLALKVVLQSSQQIPTLLFDEIDTGISGKTALVVAQKLAELSQYFQVISISHLPVIAGMAKQQLWVEKRDGHDHTKLTISPVKEDERLGKLAQMTSGQITDSSLENAREIVENADAFYNTLKAS